MTVQMNDVLQHLEADEPDYRRAASALGPDAIPPLERLAREAEPLLASKATHLASLIPSPRSRRVVEAAAARDEAEVRVAAAAALRNLPAQPAGALADRHDGVLERLLHDRDPGVRKFARRTAKTTAG